MISGVYLIKSLIDDRTYIGSSVAMQKRWGQHKSDLLKKKHGNPRLQNFVNKYGLDSIGFEELEQCSEKDLLVREQFYLDTLRPSFNIAKVAGSVRGIKRSKKSIERMRKALTGRKCPEVSAANKRRKGEKHTQEAKAKIGMGNKGKKKPWLAEMNRARAGTPLSEEHKAKMSKSLRGQKRPHLAAYNKTRRKTLTIDGITRTIFEWANLQDLTPWAIGARLGRGWTAKQAVFTEKLKSKHERPW